MQAANAVTGAGRPREWLPSVEPSMAPLFVAGALAASAMSGLVICRYADRGFVLPAVLIGLAWAAWALPRPDRVLKTMLLLTPLLNPGVRWGPFALYLSSALILLAAVSTAGSVLVAGRRIEGRDFLRHRLTLPLLLFVVVNLISMAINTGVPFHESVRILLLLLQLYAVAVIVNYVIADEAQASSLLAWLLVGGTLGATAALISAVEPGFAPWGAFGDIEGAKAPFMSMSHRVEGAFLHPNNLGIFVAYLIVALVALAGHFRRWSALVWAAGAIALVVLLLTLSRGAWLGALAGMAAVFVLQRRLPRSTVVVVGLGVVVFWLLFSQAADVNDALSHRISQMTPSSLATRQDVWEPNLQAFAQRPILGAGPGATRWTMADAHSNYLQVLVETGIVGTVIYGMLLLAVGRELLGALRRSRGTRRYDMAVAAAGVWATFLAVGLVHSSSAQVFSNWFPGLMLGLAMAISRLPMASPVEEGDS